MLAERLKQHTSVVHTDLEKKLFAHIQAVQNLQRYGSLLALMYGYYAALEKQLSEFGDSLPDY